MDYRHILLSSVSVAALLVAAHAVGGDVALAADGLTGQRAALPAVSALNAKVGAFGANLGDDTAAGVFAALALPLGWGFGAQIDGVIGTGDGEPFHGVGAHLFWRDPSRGLLGAYASHFRWEASSVIGALDLTEVGKIGMEGQLYLGRLSLEGLAAHQFGSVSGFAGQGTIAYYPRDDLRLHLGVSQLEGAGATAFAGFEWAPFARNSASLFADVGVSEDNDTRAMFGLKLYLAGEDKSLIRRHREDDPEIELPKNLFQTTRGVCPAGQVLINGFCDGNA